MRQPGGEHDQRPVLDRHDHLVGVVGDQLGNWRTDDARFRWSADWVVGSEPVVDLAPLLGPFIVTVRLGVLYVLENVTPDSRKPLRRM